MGYAMYKGLIKNKRLWASISLLFMLVGCSSDSDSVKDDLTLKSDTPFAFVKRSIESQKQYNNTRFQQRLIEPESSPLELTLPYDFNPGAKLVVRSGLDVKAIESEVLSDFFKSNDYDVKDLNVAPDGSQLIFAAHGPLNHPTDYTWNIYTYHFDEQVIRRVISSDVVANSGHDTNPTFTLDKRIVFSSDRDMGKPLSEEDKPLAQCTRVGPEDNPSLLHTMELDGSHITQLTFGKDNHDIKPTLLEDGRIAFIRWSKATIELTACDNKQVLAMNDLILGDLPSGLALPPEWSTEIKCAYSRIKNEKSELIRNEYQIMRITTSGNRLEQLYKTVATSESDEAFLFPQQIFQAENGRLNMLVKHHINDLSGGNVIELSQSQTNAGTTVFSTLVPDPLFDAGIHFYPSQLSIHGWYSAVSPYQDGTSRLLVSWAQCSTVENGINKFCSSTSKNATNMLDSQYGIWVFNPENNSRSPIVRAESDILYTELALAQPIKRLSFPFEPFASISDNEDATELVCEPELPVDPPEPVDKPDPEEPPVPTPNGKPIAMAGDDQSGPLGTEFILDGNQSSDPEEEALDFSWRLKSQPEESNALLSGTNKERVTFIPDRLGEYVIELIVNDGTQDSDPDEVIVTVVSSATLNNPPEANAGSNQSGFVNTEFTLTGENSRDIDGDQLLYLWTIVSAPLNSVANLVGPTGQKPKIIPDIVGDYVIQLEVDDQKGGKDTAVVTITAIERPNNAPIANAGENQIGVIGTVFTLDGSNSFDADGDKLSYVWTLLSQPAGSAVNIENMTGVNPSLTPNVIGDYLIQLKVDDGRDGFDNATVQVTVVEKPNTMPIANAGIDQEGLLSDVFVLDGSNSSDADGDDLSFAWSLISKPEGSVVTLVNPTSDKPSLMPDIVGVYEAQLVVFDGKLNSDPDTVMITVQKVNSVPTANAGPDQRVTINNRVTLNGAGSFDPDNDPLTYRWRIVSQPTGSNISITNPETVNPSFVPTVLGDYALGLIVNDSVNASDEDIVNITVIDEPNTAPTADAGTDQQGVLGTTFTLDGSKSTDADNDPLTYRWLIMQKPTGSGAALMNENTVSPQLTPDYLGEYVIQLIVNDGKVDSEQDTVIVRVIKGANQQPVANAGVDQEGVVGTRFILDGTNSTDPENDALEYRWMLMEKPEGSLAILDNADSSNPTLLSDKTGDYKVQLIVFDGALDSDADEVVIKAVDAPNRQPIADAGPDQTIQINQEIALNGNGSRDDDGDTLLYSWSVFSAPADSTAELVESTTVAPRFTPDIVGTYMIQLIVSDGMINSMPDTMMIVAVDTPVVNQPPVADAGPDQEKFIGETFQLNGQGSSDPEGASLMYRWNMVSKPADSSAQLIDSNTEMPSLIADRAGNYRIQLIVNDGELDSTADEVVLIAKVHPNRPPIADAGRDQEGQITQSFTLDGSGSSDPDNDKLVYRWSLVNKPDGSTVNLMNVDAPRAILMPDRVGVYEAELMVDDEKGGTDTDRVKVIVLETPNLPPIADAGRDVSTRVNTAIQLDGSGSRDPENETLSFSWSIIEKPAGSRSVLVNATSANPSLTPDVIGQYRVVLVVNDGLLNSMPDEVLVTALSRPNTAPIADAGPDQTKELGQVFQLNGSSSSDAEDDTLTYEWRINSAPSGSTANLSDATSEIPELNPDMVGDYEVILIVNDGMEDSIPDSVILRATEKSHPNNRAPIADAGPDQSVKPYQTIDLDGSKSSDPDGDVLSYQWEIVSPLDTQAEIIDANSVRPKIKLAAEDTYVVRLTVSDQLASSSDTVVLTAGNVKPVAHAGDDKTADKGERIQLDGSRSYDVDGDPLTYQWVLVSKPVNSLAVISNDKLVKPTIDIDQYGRYKMKLVVNDGLENSEPDYVVIDSMNLPPVAHAGDDQRGDFEETITLDGSRSYDPNNDEISYRWSIIKKPHTSQATLNDPTLVNPKFTLDSEGTFVIQLIVDDNELESKPDTVVVTTTQNLAPIAHAGEDQVIDTNMVVYLDGSNSYDPEGASLSYRWSFIHQPEGSDQILKDAMTQTPEFTPEAAGTYIVQLIVNDGQLDSRPDTVVIEASAPPPTCELSDATKRNFPVMIRDFKESHPDFEYVISEDYGIVKEDLGADGKPVYAHGYNIPDENGVRPSPTTHDKMWFSQWYNYCENRNIEIPKTLTLTRSPGSTLWEYRNDNFFPIDGEGWGNTGLTTPDHNYHFTLEAHLSFDYKGGEMFTFRGDDDLWLFINGKLAVDIGGVHPVIEKTIDLDELANKLGIEPGNTYSFDLFFAERHTKKSNFMLQTNLDLECVENK